MHIFTTDEIYKSGWPRDVVDKWLKDGQFFIVEFSQEQFDQILRDGIGDAKKHLHFCQRGEMWYAGVAPEVLKGIMELAIENTIAEAVTYAATHSIKDLILRKLLERK